MRECCPVLIPNLQLLQEKLSLSLFSQVGFPASHSEQHIIHLLTASLCSSFELPVFSHTCLRYIFVLFNIAYSSLSSPVSISSCTSSSTSIPSSPRLRVYSLLSLLHSLYIVKWYNVDAQTVAINTPPSSPSSPHSLSSLSQAFLPSTQSSPTSPSSTFLRSTYFIFKIREFPLRGADPLLQLWDYRRL